jgi:hypothetical protein
MSAGQSAGRPVGLPRRLGPPAWYGLRELVA